MWRGRLLDPAFVFGKGEVVSAERAVQALGDREAGVHGSTHAADRVRLRQAGRPAARSSSESKTQVFGVEVVTTLARFGFSPGAAFRDTMHFDFIEGYAHAPGGRAMSNMQKDKYGPTGDPTPTAPHPPQKKTK